MPHAKGACYQQRFCCFEDGMDAEEVGKGVGRSRRPSSGSDGEDCRTRHSRLDLSRS